MAKAAAASDVEFWPCTGDLAFRLQRTTGLIPARGLGVGRRALVAVLVTWVPLVATAAAAGRLWPGVGDEPLLQHFAVHARFLVAVPVLILGEALLHAIVGEVIPQFVRSGLVADADRARIADIVHRAIIWRDNWKPWVAIAMLVVAWIVTNPVVGSEHDLRWAHGTADHGLELAIGAFWFRYVSLPILAALQFTWLWRLGLVAVVLWRISRLRLALVATHPDQAGGLGFLHRMPAAFAPLSFALAVTLAARWAHEALDHGVPIVSFALPMATFTGIVAIVVVAPLAAFAPQLIALRRRALLEYGALVTNHGQLVHRRWIRRETVSDRGLLDAPELGPVADTVSLYEAVAATQPLPINKRTLSIIFGPIVLPVVPLIGVEVPLKDAVLKLLTTLL
jgi:hypothetical protein